MILLRWCGKLRLSNTTPLVIQLVISFIESYVTISDMSPVSICHCLMLGVITNYCCHVIWLDACCLLHNVVQHFHPPPPPGWWHQARKNIPFRYHLHLPPTKANADWIEKQLLLRSSYCTFCFQFRRTPSVSTIRTCNNSALTLWRYFMQYHDNNIAMHCCH